MKYKIIKEEIVFDNFFKIKKAKIKHELFDSNTIEVDRLSFERGDSVAILIYEKDTDSLLFTNQFRYPTIKEKDGWILEYSEVNSTDKIFNGGGMKYEKEDIQLIKIKTKEVIKQLKNNKFRDAKTIIGIQWFLMNKIQSI